MCALTTRTAPRNSSNTNVGNSETSQQGRVGFGIDVGRRPVAIRSQVLQVILHDGSLSSRRDTCSCWQVARRGEQCCGRKAIDWCGMHGKEGRNGESKHDE